MQEVILVVGVLLAAVLVGLGAILALSPKKGH